jgi:pimeloyl-ACP methyl ester carboxylesterase
MNDASNHVLSDGCRIAYDRRGEGPPVLFIQGVGVHGDGWRPQIDELASRFTCLSFDHRGIGRSGAAEDDFTVELLAADSLAILDREGIGAAHVVGHSLGGLVALVLASRARERVRSLSLLCTFPSGRAAAPLSPRMMWLGMRSRVGTRRQRRHGFLRLVLAPSQVERIDLDALASQLAPLFGHDLGDLPEIASRQLRAMRRCDPSPGLGELARIPTLVVSARHDPIAPPAVGRRLAESIEGARYVEFDDASHGLPITHAAEVNRLLAEHLAPA